MQRRNFYSYLFVCLCLISLTTHSLAQTITTGSITPSSICPSGGSVAVTYTVTGTFSATNTFSAQLSDATGGFTASTVIGSVSSASAVTINATIPATATGSYKIRVVSSSPATIGTTSDLVINVPSPPGTSPVSYCVGQTASALIAVPTSDGTLNWYGTAATGGTASAVAPTPSTTTANTTTYYVSQTVNGCESDRASLVVTVSSAPPAPGVTVPTPYCQGAGATALSATGTGLLWYGTNATGGTASSVAPTPSTSDPGTTTYYVSQSVGSCESPRAAITVTVNAAPSAPATSPAPSYCQNQPATALVATASAGATLNWYGTSATGGTASTSATTPSTTLPGITNYYVSQTLSGCESPRASITVNVNAIPGAPTVGPASLCQNNANGPLTAIPTTGGTLNWYGTAATGGTASGTAPTPPTNTVGSTTYYVSQSVNGCEGPRAAITVTVNALPAAPAGNTPAPYCQGAGAAALSATGTGLLWYGTNATGGTASSVAPTPNTATPGTTIYYVTQTISGCESPRTGITVTVKPAPGAPSVAVISFCQGTNPPALTATPSSGGTLNWYGTNATGGTASTIAPILSNATPGTTMYYVSQTLSGCESPRAAITVTVNATPAAPGVTPITVCQNSAANLAATASAGGTLNWYGTAATGGTASGTAPTPPTNTVGSTTYYVSQSVNGCEGPRAAITVTVNALPAAPAGNTPAPYCQGAGAAALSATGTGLLWYGTNATGGTASSVAPTPNTATPGTTIYYVTQTISGCESPRTGIIVTVKPKPGLPTTSSIAFCQGSASPTLTADFATSATPNWYGTNATGGIPSPNAPAPPNTTVGTTVYYVSQTVNGCESDRATLSVRVKATPAAPSVAAIGFCNNGPSSQLTANGQNLKWYDSSGTILGGAPTPNTSTVGNQVFNVSQSIESCESPKATLTVTIKPLPNAPGVSNLTYCLQTQDQPAQNVTALTAFGTELKWFNTDGNQYPSAPIPSITTVGTQSYQVSQTYNGCEGSKATLQVTIRTTAAPTVAKPLVTYCINEKAVPLEASAESGGSLRWVDPYGNISPNALTPSTLNTSIKPDGDAFYVFQVGQNTCYSDRSLIKVIVNALPTLSLTAPVNNINLGQRADLQLKFTSIPPFSYTLTDGLSGVVNRVDTTLSLLPRTTTTYQIASVRNSCGVGLPGNPATATITVRIPTVTTSALTTSTLCAGTSLSVPFTTTGQFNQGNQFRIELISIADTTKKYAVSASTTESPVTAPLPTTLVSGQYYVRVNADNPEIAVIGSNSPTQLTVHSQPTATLTGTQNIYEGYPASLTLTFGGESPWTVTYADSVRSYTTTATTTPYSVEVRPSTKTTYQLVSVVNACGNGPVSGTATVTVLPLLGIEDDPLGPLVKTYPVPTTSILTIELDLPLTRTPATLSLTDMSGKAVLQQTTKNQKHELDLTAHPNGLYLLRIQVGDKQTVRKVLKQ